MWWTYFGWFKDGLEARLAGIASAHQGRFARDAYSLAHFLLVCGIVGVAVSFEEIAAHPDEALDAEVIGALTVGLSLFLGASALAWLLAWRRVLWARIAVPAGLICVLAVFHDAEAVWVLGLAAASLVALIAIEERLGSGKVVASHPAAEHSH
jgi:low temperature requirement protein LtrA